MKPLWSAVEVNENIVGGDAGEGNGKSNPCVDRVRVQRQEDHEETREAENHWDEERDLKRAGEVRFCIPEVDQTQHHYTNEQPPQEAHEVQQAVDVSHKQLEHGHRVQYEDSSQWSVSVHVDHRQNFRELSFTRCHEEHS